jgi:hypothetical protein
VSCRTASAAACVLCAIAQVACARAEAGFWFAEDALTLPDHLARQLGGPLTGPEKDAIRATSRSELRRAFAGWQIAFTESEDAYWPIEAVPQLPGSGQAFTWGLRGHARVGVAILVSNAMQHASPGASRAEIIEGIGKGIGRAAAHELAHLIGTSAHDHSDPDSYEYVHSNRRSQYYGELHWTIALPALDKRLGPAPRSRGES